MVCGPALARDALGTVQSFAFKWTLGYRSVTSDRMRRLEPGARILLVRPSLDLREATLSGVNEVVPEWSAKAQDNLVNAISHHFEDRGMMLMTVNFDGNSDPQIDQMLKLNAAVTNSISKYTNLGGGRLPSKAGFDWTLGEDVSVLCGSLPPRERQRVQYILFVSGSGSYPTARKIALSSASLLVGGLPNLGSQQLIATLVDARTGQVVWFEQREVALGKDLRTPEGAEDFVDLLVRRLPL